MEEHPCLFRRKDAPDLLLRPEIVLSFLPLAVGVKGGIEASLR
jgi:hypothetical protein